MWSDPGQARGECDVCAGIQWEGLLRSCGQHHQGKCAACIRWSLRIKDTLGLQVVCPLYRDCPLLRDSNHIILIGGIKFGDLVLSIVERYLIQCPFLGES